MAGLEDNTHTAATDLGEDLVLGQAVEGNTTDVRRIAGGEVVGRRRVRGAVGRPGGVAAPLRG